MAKNIDLRSIAYTPMVYTSVGAVVAGAYVAENDINGFTLADIGAGGTGVLVMKADQVKCAKDATVAVAAGEKAYWNVAAANITNVALGSVLVGHFVRDDVSAATEALIEWDGTIEGQEA